MNIKKKLTAAAAALILTMSVMPLAMAATPEPANNLQPTQAVQTAQPDAAPVSAAQTQTADTEFINNKYLTKGGAAFWFIFTIVINTVISFGIGNRFYRLSRKDNHVSGEIRALRKDIEEKFARSVGGFAEAEVDITNSNENYAGSEEIKIPSEQPLRREVSSEEEERFRKWEAAQEKPRSARKAPAPKSAVKEELQEELGEVKRIRKKNYLPKRQDSASEKKEDLEATKEIRLRGEGVKNKAKEILGDIFPFKED